MVPEVRAGLARMWGAHRRRAASLVVAGLLAFVASPIQPASAVVGTFLGGNVTSPFGLLMLGTHYWLSDHIAGFCRLDPNPDGTVSINTSTCHQEALAPTQASFDPVTDFVYVGDTVARGGAGVERYHWNPSTELIDAAISLAPGANLASVNPMATALGSDGALYIGAQKNNNIYRISNPAAATTDVPFQTAPVIGTNGGLRQTRALTWIGADLWISNGIGVYTIGSAAACTQSAPCTATQSAIQSTAPLAIGSDGRDQVWWAESPGGVSYIERYTISTNTQDVMAIQGTLPDGSTTGFAFVSGGVNLDGLGNVVFGDDPTAGSTVGQGRLWRFSATAAPAAAGSPGVPATIPPPASNNAAPEIGTGLTAPLGELFLTNAQGVTHIWESDGALGFCRLDGPAANGTVALNPASCVTPTSKPGQPAYDPVNQFVYLPDASSHSQGVFRLTYDPTTDTVRNAVVLAPGQGLGGNLPDAAALDPFDGNLYVSMLKNGDIDRVTTPAGSSQTVVKVGASTDGRRVKGLAFAGSQGRDLWLAEKSNVTVMSQVDRCAVSPNGLCRPVIVVANVGPQAIETDGADTIYWINQVIGVPPNSCPCPADVHKLAASTRADGIVLTTGVLPSGSAVRIQLASAVKLDAFGNLYVGDDPNGGFAPNGQGHLWKMTPTQADVALSMTANGAFAVGDTDSFTLTVLNNGPFPASPPLIVTDSLPAGLTFASSAGAGWTCTAAAQIVTCINPTALDGGGATSNLTLNVTVGAGFVAGSTNSAAVTAQTDDPTWDVALTTPNNNLASVVIAGTADVSVTGTASPSPVGVGGSLTYGFTVANGGPTQASGTTLNLPLPSGVTFGSASATQGNCSFANATVTCALGTLASGGSAGVTVVVTATAAAASPITVTATVSANETDPNLTNNSVTLSTVVTQIADVAVSTTVPGPATVGSSVTYTVTISNLGPSTATGVTLTDTLPAGSGFVSATPLQGTCSQTAATVTCVAGDLTASSSTTVTIVVTVPSPGAIANISAVSANEQDPNLANNSAAQVSTVS